MLRQILANVAPSLRQKLANDGPLLAKPPPNFRRIIAHRGPQHLYQRWYEFFVKVCAEQQHDSDNQHHESNVMHQQGRDQFYWN
jgi:hypothetical protein